MFSYTQLLIETSFLDVVTAYKGLVREKKALEAGLGALKATDESSVPGINSSQCAYMLSLSLW